MSSVPESWRLVALFAAVPGLLFGVLVREGRGQPALATDDAVLLQYSPRGRRLLLGCVLALLPVAAVPITCWLAAVPDQPALWLQALIPLVLAVPVLGWWRHRAVVVHADPAGISVRHGAGPLRRIGWPDLQLVHLSLGPFGCRLQGRNGERLRFPGTLPGIAALLARIRRQVPAVRWRRWGRSVQAFQEGQKQHLRRG